MTTITEVIKSFEYLYQEIHNRAFVKTLAFNKKTERALLPFIRFYLLGYFNKIRAESSIEFEPNRCGRIDFIIDDIAVEFAVKTAYQSSSNLSAGNNEKEIKKLMGYEGLSVLILFNFQPNVSYDEVFKTLKEYRDLPATKNSIKSPFTVVYFYIDENGDIQQQKAQIRVNK